jgi:hypothetical protein
VLLCRRVFISRWIRRRSPFAVACAASAWFVSSAWAADPSEIEKLIRQGVELRRAHDDHQALPLFQKAYDLAPTPRTAAQLGLAESSLGYVVEAQRHLTESLAATHDPWVNRNRKALEEAAHRVRARIGEVVVTGHPEGADVVLNGAAVAKLPLAAALKVPEGPAKIEVRAPGYRSAQRTVTVVGEQRASVTVELEADRVPTRLSGALPPEGGRPQPTPFGAPNALPRRDSGPVAPLEPRATPLTVAKEDTASEDSAASSKAPSIARPAAWALTVAAGAAVGFGIYESFVWSNRKGDFESHSKLVPDKQLRLRDCGASVAGRGGPECEALYESASRAKNLLTLGYGVGAALAAGAAILFVVSSPSDSETSQALACGPSLLGAACGGSF